MFFNKEKRAEQKAQRSALAHTRAAERASRIKGIFQRYELLGKPLSAQGWPHNILTDIWILDDVFVKNGAVHVQFVLPLDNKRIWFNWYDFRRRVDYGTDRDVVETLFLKARQKYLSMEKEILAIHNNLK